jgi:subtilase family serine protease
MNTISSRHKEKTMKTMFALSRQPRLRMCGMLAACVLTASSLSAQSPLPRIHNEVNSSATTVVRGSQHPLALPQYDAGRMPSGTRMNGVTLYFSRSAAQQAALNALLAAQQDPSSPQYHKWLTPEQFGAQFGMAQSDIEKVKAWLEQQGFAVGSVMRSATGIRFSGTVGQVEAAFGTEMHYYTVGGEKHFAPATALSVPSALADVVAGVRNLDDFRPKAQHIPVRKNFTSGTSGNNYFAPPDIVTAYDMQTLYNASVNGAGETIAIMGQSFINISDIEAFQSAAGLAKKDPQLVLVPGSGNDGVFSPGDESESDLDLEWSSSMAPGANVIFVYTGSDTNFGVYDSAQYAIDNNVGNIISLSYSTCETQLDSSTLTSLENMFSQAAAQGQTVMAASGDAGSTACYGDTSLSTAQQEAIVVNYPASSAYVTGVGGTEAPAADYTGGGSAGANTSTYWNSNGSDMVSSLIKYIPEIVWNDSPTSGCPAATNCLSATGGGKSTLVAQPSWQTTYFSTTGESNPDSSHRLVPDIAFYSSPGAPGYLYCTSDQSAWDTADGQVGSCTSGFRDGTSNLLTVAGGTSFATPIFAGMVALLNQQGNYVTGSGEINKELYTLAANSATYAAVFHDVTSGNNFCNTPSNCAGTGSGTGYSATTGYDMVTGLGSFDVAKLAAIWPMSTNMLAGSKVSVQPANSSVAAGTDDIVTITVTGQTGSTVPTGTVTLQIDGGPNFGGSTVTNQTLNSSGQLTYTANFSTAGTHQVVAQYSGDAAFATSTGVGVIVVTGGSGTGSFTVASAPSTLTIAQGSTGTTTLTVTPANGYTGTVAFSYSLSSSALNGNNFCIFVVSGFDSNGNLNVTGTSAVSGQLKLDTNGSDCSGSVGGARTGHGMHLMPRTGSGAAAANHKPGSSLPGGGLALAGLLLAGLLGRASRRLRSLACVIALASVMFGLSACGSSSGSSSQNAPKGTYTVTFQGQDSTHTNVTAQTSFTLVIN